jgi:ADP-ribose pyrophosphatase
MNEQLHLFVAEGLTPGPMALEADEQLDPVKVPLVEAVRMCLSGEIKDAKTITSLLLWERKQKAD